MSFTITKTGPHRDQRGCQCRVVHIEGKWAIGFDSGNEPCAWQVKTGIANTYDRWNIVAEWHDQPEPPAGFRVMPKDYVATKSDMTWIGNPRKWYACVGHCGHSAADLDVTEAYYEPHYIASPIPAPPKPDPGEGWRLLEDGELTAIGDERMDGCDREPRPWLAVGRHGLDVASYVAVYAPLKIMGVRRRIPAPFRISTHGPGIYETRDGRQAIVGGDGLPFWYGEVGPWENVSWGDSGIERERSSGLDLIRYIGPLPEPEPTLKFKVGDRVQWTPTCEWRRRQIERPVRGAKWVCAEASDYMHGKMILVIDEQLWTSREKSEWRAVQVTT